MNLKPLFEMQRVLDNRIIEEKGLEEQDLFPEKILALKVEIGELANEWRGFKFWSERKGFSRLDTLEEYVDCLHFILSIGLERNYTFVEPRTWHSQNLTNQFLRFDYYVTNFHFSIESDWHEEEIQEQYEHLINGFLGLGEMLGFTWEQIEQAYKEKNATNHLRQSNHY